MPKDDDDYETIVSFQSEASIDEMWRDRNLTVAQHLEETHKNVEKAS